MTTEFSSNLNDLIESVSNNNYNNVNNEEAQSRSSASGSSFEATSSFTTPITTHQIEFDLKRPPDSTTSHFAENDIKTNNSTFTMIFLPNITSLKAITNASTTTEHERLISTNTNRNNKLNNYMNAINNRKEALKTNEKAKPVIIFSNLNSIKLKVNKGKNKKQINNVTNI